MVFLLRHHIALLCLTAAFSNDITSSVTVESDHQPATSKSLNTYDFATGVITFTLAGSNGGTLTTPSAEVDGLGTYAGFSSPYGIAIDYLYNDFIYISDNSTNHIRQYTISTSQLVTLHPQSDISTPLIGKPRGMVTDNQNHVYLAHGNMISKLTIQNTYATYTAVPVAGNLTGKFSIADYV